MSDNLYHGRLVRLGAGDPKRDAELVAAASRTAEFGRLLDSDPARPVYAKALQEEWEKEEEEHDSVFFTIYTLPEEQPIGFVALGGISQPNGDAWIGIGIWDADYRGKGYGTDAMRLVLRYAFRELNLHRVTLGVFGYNPRARRSYEKAGFKVEGIARKEMRRDGRSWDVYYMGILRREWEESQAQPERQEEER